MLYSLPSTLAGRVVDQLVADHQLTPTVTLANARFWVGTKGKALFYAALVVPGSAVDRHIVTATSPTVHLVLDASCCSQAYELRLSLVPSDLPSLGVLPSAREFAELSTTVDGYVSQWSRLVR